MSPKKYQTFFVKFDNQIELNLKRVKKCFNRGDIFQYIGVHRSQKTNDLYIQTSKSERMTESKIKFYLNNLGNFQGPFPFTVLEGECVESQGCVKKRGRENNSKVTGGKVENITNNINNSGNVVNNVTNNIVINLHINALGEEDISHIKEKMLSEIVKARIEEVQSEILGILSEERCSCESSSSRFPHSSVMCNVLHEYIHTRRRDNREEVSERGSDSDDSDRDDVRPTYCEPEEYSEEDSKERLRAIKDLICWKTREEGVFSNRFEELLYENPSNRNIKYSEGKGYFTYFDGNRFQNERKSDYYDRVIRKRLKKSAEWMNTLKDRKEMTDFQAEYVNTAIEFLSNLSTSDNPRTLKKMVNNSLQLAVNSEIKIPGVTVKKINDPENAGRFDTVEKIKGNAWEATRGRL